MRALRKDVKTLDDYCGLQKGDRLKFLITQEDKLGSCFGTFLDNRVRNSIGHGNTRFDPISQRLDFYSKIGQETPAVTKFLLEFANDCRMMLLGIFRVMEINSWLERVFLMGVGQKPENGPGWASGDQDE